MREPKSISFDRIAHLYDETRALPSSQMRTIVEAFHQELEGFQTLLEVGVGTGRFALPLQERGVRLLGVDISPRMMQRGLQRGLRNVLLADALELPIKDLSVDATYSIHVLHLVGDWKRALREIARVTREAYFTVASYWEDRRTPHTVYWEALGEFGIKRDIPGVFERKLPEILPPTRRFVIGSFRESRRVAEATEILAKRGFSGQWDVPKEAHAAAMRAVREEFSDRVLTLEKRVELIRWDVEDLIQD